MGIVNEVVEVKGNLSFRIQSSITHELKVDQSLAHNGICLTVEGIFDNIYHVTAVPETIKKTNIGSWEIGDLINLERSIQMNGRLDGHIVQGHIDTVARCISRESNESSWIYRFEYPQTFASLLIEKGSVTVNGISLTCHDINDFQFSVSIIPYTFQNTNIQHVFAGEIVNIEFDILGKYIHRLASLSKKQC